jgi:hypothetical protein
MKHFWKSCGTVLIILVGLVVLIWGAYQLLIEPWQMHWGASDAEVGAVLPGDALIPNRQGDQSTRGITIEATPAEIWPWLVQMGADKGGLYSYTSLERMAQCPQVNADRIHPEWQDLKPGDLLRMCPENSGPPPFQVAAIQPEAALIVGHPAQNEAELALGLEWVDAWSFILQPVDADTTRLLIRSRLGMDASWRHILEFGVFIMERGMLRGIRDRAEGN